MESESKIGMNRSGIQMSPFEGPNQVDYALSQPAHPAVGDGQADIMRAQYVSTSERTGSVPLPGTAKGVAMTAVDKLTGKSPEVLIDKLGQRLAFERSGVRLYEAMIRKVQAVQPSQAENLLADLQHICSEELSHFQMLTQVIQDMGADPTAQTPAADVSGVASLGILQVITDPRTTVPQSLEALLTAELTDSACWELLMELVEQTGHDKLAQPFREALGAEEEHVAKVRSWLRRSMLEET